jgi:hypothetical protein
LSGTNDILLKMSRYQKTQYIKKTSNEDISFMAD